LSSVIIVALVFHFAIQFKKIKP